MMAWHTNNMNAFFLITTVLLLAFAGALAWATAKQHKITAHVPDEGAVKKRMLMSAIAIVLPIIALLLLWLSFRSAAHGFCAYIYHLSCMLGTAISLYTIYTYPFIKQTIENKKHLVVGSVVILVLLALILLSGGFLLFLVTLAIWLHSILYLRKSHWIDFLPTLAPSTAPHAPAKPAASSASAPSTPQIPASPSSGNHVASLVLCGNKGYQEWRPSQSPIQMGCNIYKTLSSDAAAVPAAAYELKCVSSDGRMWHLYPLGCPSITIFVNNAPVSTPVSIQAGARISLLPSGKSFPSEAIAPLMVKQRLV